MKQAGEKLAEAEKQVESLKVQVTQANRRTRRGQTAIREAQNSAEQAEKDANKATPRPATGTGVYRKLNALNEDVRAPGQPKPRARRRRLKEISA